MQHVFLSVVKFKYVLSHVNNDTRSRNLSIPRVMTQMEQQLMKMKRCTSSQITPELLCLGHWGQDLNPVQETSPCQARPGNNFKSLSENSYRCSGYHLHYIHAAIFSGRSCMKRSCVSRSRSCSSSMKSARGLLKSKARSRTCSGLVLTFRY